MVHFRITIIVKSLSEEYKVVRNLYMSLQYLMVIRYDYNHCYISYL